MPLRAVGLSLICYWGGFNPAALAAFGLGVLPNLPGFLHKAKVLTSVPPIFDDIYAQAWFVGFILAGVLYGVLMAIGNAIERRGHGS